MNANIRTVIMANKGYYQQNRARLLELARIYREKNREEIDRVQPLVGCMELVMRFYKTK